MAARRHYPGEGRGGARAASANRRAGRGRLPVAAAGRGGRQSGARRRAGSRSRPPAPHRPPRPARSGPARHAPGPAAQVRDRPGRGAICVWGAGRAGPSAEGWWRRRTGSRRGGGPVPVLRVQPPPRRALSAGRGPRRHFVAERWRRLFCPCASGGGAGPRGAGPRGELRARIGRGRGGLQLAGCDWAAEGARPGCCGLRQGAGRGRAESPARRGRDGTGRV